MNDYFGGQSPQELEALLRRLITQGAEGPKMDFKKAFGLTEKSAQAELAKDISSIANTDDEAHLDDFGHARPRRAGREASARARGGAHRQRPR